MKNLATILSAVALVGVGVLFFLFFKGNKSTKSAPIVNGNTDSHTHGQIGYFEMDSIEQHYSFVKEVREQLKKQEDNISNELNSLKKSYMTRIQQLQQKAPTMSQQEGEAAQAEINQMQLTLQQKEAKLAQDLQERQFKMMQEINDKITTYLKVYNEQKKFSYIISHSPGDFVYFTDSSFNITNDVINGLNESFKK